MVVVLLGKSGASKLNRLEALWIFSDIYVYLLAEYSCTTFHSYEQSRANAGMGGSARHCSNSHLTRIH